jgi:hypothetical protein
MTVRQLWFVVMHPVRYRRHVKAVNAPWPKSES